MKRIYDIALFTFALLLAASPCALAQDGEERPATYDENATADLGDTNHRQLSAGRAVSGLSVGSSRKLGR